MKIKHITIDKSSINKNNFKSKFFNYHSIVNNDSSETSPEIINTAALVLFDLYKSGKEQTKNETEKSN